MASVEIARALEPEEWARQRCGDASIETVEGEEHLLIRNAAGELDADTGPADLCACWSQRLIDILAALLPPRRNHCG